MDVANAYHNLPFVLYHPAGLNIVIPGPRSERVVIFAEVLALAGAAWAYTAWGAWRMDHMDRAPGMFMPHAGPWHMTEWWLLFVMWAVMMVAMMLPSATPLILLFAETSRKRRAAGRPALATPLFISGYLMVWVAFSLLATIAQWILHQTALLSPMMKSRSALFGGCVLMAAGIFQWTPWKHACLRHCRSPLGFLLSHWHPGNVGALRTGLEHGVYCSGCCWALMALLFVAGVMNLLWVAIIAAYVLVEKIAPRGEWIGRVAGLALFGWGVFTIVV